MVQFHVQMNFSPWKEKLLFDGLVDAILIILLLSQNINMCSSVTDVLPCFSKVSCGVEMLRRFHFPEFTRMMRVIR
jgi:hypothetical protein